MNSLLSSIPGDSLPPRPRVEWRFGAWVVTLEVRGAVQDDTIAFFERFCARELARCRDARGAARREGATLTVEEVAGRAAIAAMRPWDFDKEAWAELCEASVGFGKRTKGSTTGPLKLRVLDAAGLYASTVAQIDRGRGRGSKADRILRAVYEVVSTARVDPRRAELPEELRKLLTGSEVIRVTLSTSTSSTGKKTLLEIYTSSEGKVQAMIRVQ